DVIIKMFVEYLIYAAAYLYHNVRYAQQVTHVGLTLPFAALVKMKHRRVTKSIHKTVCEHRLFDDGLRARQVFRYLRRALASNRRISRYNQMSVTIRPNEPYHSMYFGAPPWTPVSIMSKSRTKFRAAMTTTKRLKPIPTAPLPLIAGT